MWQLDKFIAYDIVPKHGVSRQRFSFVDLKILFAVLSVCKSTVCCCEAHSISRYQDKDFNEEYFCFPSVVKENPFRDYYNDSKF
jgi:hypothetical protein